MDNTLVADKLQAGILKPGQVNMQSLTKSGGWFTKTNAAGVQADTIVSDVINDAYKTRLDGFGTNAKRMFTDIKNKALEMDTYINDEQIGSFVESNKAASSFVMILRSMLEIWIILVHRNLKLQQRYLT